MSAERLGLCDKFGDSLLRMDYGKREEEIRQHIAAFLEGLRLSWDEEFRRHYLSTNKGMPVLVRHPKGRGDLICTVEGGSSLLTAIDAYLSAHPRRKNMDLNVLFNKLCNCILTDLDLGGTGNDELSVDFSGSLDKVIAEHEAEHKEHTYYFPCVLFAIRKKYRLRIGPVRFTSTNAFLLQLEDLEKNRTKHVDENVFKQQAKEHFAQFNWVASVKVPVAASKISQKRAAAAVNAAINYLRIWFGISRTSRMRLVSTSPAMLSETRYIVETDTHIWGGWSRSMEGVPIDEETLGALKVTELPFYGPFHLFLNQILEDDLSDSAERLRDALAWIGDASFETSPGAALTKIVFALERITRTGYHGKHHFCVRVALLAFDTELAIEECYWSAYELYASRSRIAHGVEPQDSPKHKRLLLKSEQLISYAMGRFIELHGLFCLNDKRWSTLQQFFDSEMNKQSSLFVRLHKEAAARDAQEKRSSP